MPHKGHPACVYDTKAACDKARKEALGRCTAMTSDKRTPTQCSKWAQSMVGGQGVCNTHAETVLSRQLAEERRAQRMAEMQDRISAFMRWTADHPSVWDNQRG